MQLPDAEKLINDLVEQIRPNLTANTALVGIHTGGAWLAQRLHQQLNMDIPPGVLDITFYRDDFSKEGLHPMVKPSNIPFDVEGRNLVLVDDVLHTGRTVRAAMNELFDYGRPDSIQLAVLIDRGGRELPIAATYAGATLALQPSQNVQLKQDEQGRFSLVLMQ